MAKNTMEKLSFESSPGVMETLLVVIGFVLPRGGGCQRREACADRPWSAGDIGRARIVDAPLGTAVAFRCDYCGERDKGEAKFWYTSPRLHSSGSVHTGRKEVTLGMIDPVESNRVYMTFDHSLVIQNLTLSDIGRYSCSGLGINVRVEFALDLLPRSNSTGVTGVVSADSMADWTRYESEYLVPVMKKFPQVQQMGSDWDAWSPCDGCASKRYRRAACRVQFNDTTRMACRSIGLPENVPLDLALVLSSVPDFLLAETCYAYCQALTKHRLPKYRNTFVLEEGSSLTLMCAEATADEKVIWRRDGILLSESATDGVVTGASLDMFGTLYLVGLTISDSGNYTCYLNGNRTQEVLLTVRKSSMLSSKAYVRHLYYLYFVIALYTVMFGARIYYAFLNRHGFLKISDDDVLKPKIPTPYLGKTIRLL